MTHEVFICHSSSDATIAKIVCATLESKHIQCWIAPRDVLPGAIWGEVVAKAIDESRIVVLVLSINSCSSSQVVREVERAASNNTPIIPLRIDEVSISGAIGFFVSSRHWLDAQTPPFRKHLMKLADTVKQLLEQEQVPQTGINMPQIKTAVLIKEDSEAVKAIQQVLNCPKCGNKLRPGAGFCNKCGTRVREIEKAEVEDKAEREAEEARKTKEAREKAEREAEEARKTKEAREKAEREAEEARKTKEAREKAEREAEEARKAKEAREKAEREAEEARKSKEAREKAEREAEEARKSKEAREKAEREAAAIKTIPPALYCTKCGIKLRPGAGFCNKCGARISRGEKDK